MGGERTYELVAPDGGWGYLICVAVILNYTSMTGFVSCFGMLYRDFFEEANIGSTTVTLLGGIQGLAVALNGFATAPLLKILSTRQLTLLGSIFYVVGLFGLVFATTKAEFLIFTGFCGGAGYGFVFNVSSTVFNEYFVKKRMFAFSLIQTAIASIAMVMPTVIKVCLDKYGFRGTQLIVTGIALHMFVATALMQPVRRHMKKVEIQKGPEKKLLLPVDQKGDIETTKVDDVNNKPATNVKDDKQSNIRQWIDRLFDLSAISPLLKSTVSWALMLCTFCELNFMLLVPQGLYSFGWSENEVSNALSSLAFGDLSTRIGIIIFTKWLSRIRSEYIYLFGVIIAILTRLVILWADNKTIVLIAFAVMGVPHCTILTFMPLVLAEIITPDKFAAAIGFCMLSFGIGSIILGPIIGAVRDYTDSYVVAFYAYILLLSIAFMLWFLEICYRNYRKRFLNKHENKLCNK